MMFSNYTNNNNTNNQQQQQQDSGHNSNNNNTGPSSGEIERALHATQTSLAHASQFVASAAGHVGSTFSGLEMLLQEQERLRQENALLRRHAHDVARIVARFSAVEDPVVASDGYTYERRDLTQYLTDSQASGSPARSHITNEAITDAVVPNFSMKRLLALLKECSEGIPSDISSESGKDSSTAPNAASASITSLASLQSVPAAAQQQQQSQPQVFQQAVGSNNNNNGGSLVVLHATPSAPNSAQQQSLVVGQQATAAGRSAGQSPAEAQSMNSTHSAVSSSSPKPPAPNLSGKTHPCLRVYGRCKFNDTCVFAKYPYEACLSFLKGKCKFGGACLEPHFESFH